MGTEPTERGSSAGRGSQMTELPVAPTQPSLAVPKALYFLYCAANAVFIPFVVCASLHGTDRGV